MSEERLHLGICKYLRLQYPKVLFNSDLSGRNFHEGIRGRISAMRSSRAFPDLVVYEEVCTYHAMFLEIKLNRDILLRKDGHVRQSSHLQEQTGMLIDLIDRGYFANFVCGFDEAKDVIDWYLGRIITPYPGGQYLEDWGITY